MKISFTKDSFDGKVNPSLFEFEHLDVSPLEFLTKLRNGFNYCGLFKDEKGNVLDEFNIKEKTKNNFLGTNVVTIDIDVVDPNEFPTIESYLNKIGDFKPSLVYPTYHHNKEKKGCDVICIRFHLVYLFNETLTDIDYYNVVDRIKQDLPTPTDENAEHHVQFFYGCYNFNEGYVFGRNKDNMKVWSITDLNKGFTDFDTFEELKYHKVLPEVVERPITEEYLKNLSEYHKLEEKFSKDDYKGYELNKWLYFDIKRDIEIKDLYKRYGKTYKCVYRKEKQEWCKFEDSLGGLQVIDKKEFFKLDWMPRELTIYDGERGGRRRFVYNRMCLVKLLKEDIGINELMFNYYVFVKQHVLNSGKQKVFNHKKILDECMKIVKTPIEELRERYKKVIDKLKQNPKLQNKSGLIATRGVRPKEVLKQWRMSIIKDTYNPNLTDKMNLFQFKLEVNSRRDLEDYIVEQLLDTSLTTFKRYKSEISSMYDVPMKSQTKVIHTDEELLSTIDFSLSSRENLKLLKLQGYKVGINRVQSLLKKYA